MQKLLNPKFLRNLIISIMVIGLRVMAISGYLTPIFSLSLTPLIGTQSWLAERYSAFKDFSN